MNSDSGWLLVKGSHKSFWAVAGDGVDLGDLAVFGEGLLSGLAGSVSGGVRVVSLSGKTTVVNSVLDTLVFVTTVASHISVSTGAVNEFLFREVEELSFEDAVSTFNGTDSRESPA